MPDHTTFARFRSFHFAPCAQELMGEMAEFLYRPGEISGETIFIDGTKIEACANKYTFVWKKVVTKNLEKLLLKLAAFVESCEALCGIKVVYHDQVQLRHVKKLRKKLYAMKESGKIGFVHGTGKRKSLLQKSIETLEGYLDKLKEYTRKLHMCGERNSYFKTDPDATFMRMKMTADAGYKSEENYNYLEEKGIESYIKPLNDEVSKSMKYQKDIGRIENMEYDSQKDVYICHEGRGLKVGNVKRQKTQTGYERETTIYGCGDCGRGPSACFIAFMTKKKTEKGC